MNQLKSRRFSLESIVVCKTRKKFIIGRNQSLITTLTATRLCCCFDYFVSLLLTLRFQIYEISDINSH
ncbi:CLUMA_CG009059, isoform A [Clunio marinus]|uniref:CLUMA_CG009059, isoform A n=1 Tax=Clunio marinus TaxID=568069 RepID=A0A1J1I5P9_9DIPT|nr:CLUMA_CG009059, isoform A [Clunio marinus]